MFRELSLDDLDFVGGGTGDIVVTGVNPPAPSFDSVSYTNALNAMSAWSSLNTTQVQDTDSDYGNGDDDGDGILNSEENEDIVVVGERPDLISIDGELFARLYRDWIAGLYRIDSGD